MLINEKTESQKSCDTVPLIKDICVKTYASVFVHILDICHQGIYLHRLKI
jgi:hypothetical protein